MGLLDYVFRRVVAYEAIRGVASAQSGPRRRAPTSSSRDYRAFMSRNGPRLAAAFDVLGDASSDAEKRAALSVLRHAWAQLQVEADATPAPPEFAQTDTEIRLAASLYLSAIDTALAAPDSDDWLPAFSAAALIANDHFKAASAAAPNRH